MSTEAGGLNSSMPFAVAAELGIPLVDADRMGRAFPEIQMVTPTLSGISATPMSMADEKGNSCILNTINNRWTETFARTITVDMGCSALIALFAMTGKQLKEATVAGTIIESRIDRPHDPRGACCARRSDRGRASGNRRHLIWKGKIADLNRRTETGFARGTAVIDGVDEYEGRQLQIDFQNEFLIAREGDAHRRQTPDLITILDRKLETRSRPNHCDTATGSRCLACPATPGGARRKGSNSRALSILAMTWITSQSKTA